MTTTEAPCEQPQRNRWGLHPDQGMELAKSNLHKIAQHTVRARSSQLFFGPVTGDSHTHQPCTLCGSNTRCGILNSHGGVWQTAESPARQAIDVRIRLAMADFISGDDCSKTRS